MDLWLGFLFLLVGAACGGSFGLPSKYAKEDTPWEVLWGPFFFFVTVKSTTSPSAAQGRKRVMPS